MRLHTHLCETLDEERFPLQTFGLRPVAYMESLGWVGDDVWYAHAGRKVLHLIEGRLRVELEGRDDVVLDAGDCLVHAAHIPHRWRIEGDASVRLFLVVLRDPA